MKKLLIFLAFFSVAAISTPNQNRSHRLSANVGGFYLVMGYGLASGLSYEWAFHRYLALEVEADYNFSIFAMGQGPCHSVGVNISLEGMVYNFGEKDFSKGFGFSLGVGNHYLVDYNYSSPKGNSENYYIPTLTPGFFYSHLFDNNLFIKTGLKIPAVQATMSTDKFGWSWSEAKILPKIFFSLGYAF